MKLHEYQAKELLARHGVAVPRGRVASTAADAGRVAADLGGPVVVKAQAHTGARGKAGGIRLTADPAAAQAAAGELLGSRLVTDQTGPAGLPVAAVLVEERVAIARELYLSVAIDTGAGLPMVIASAAGGMEIEQVAAERPEQIHRQHVDPTCGLQPFQARALAFACGLDGELLAPAVRLIEALVGAFEGSDARLVEVNPLVVTEAGTLLAGDAKFEVDDNALFRQPELAGLRDRSQEAARELEAHDAGIDNYVKLDGDIGCLVNGAGLAMATMDAIQLAGGEPANFLDIGTANRQEAVVAALRIIGADPDVRAVLINIFGGLARTDIIAAGLVEAKSEGALPQPTVVRLAGTNVARAAGDTRWRGGRVDPYRRFRRGGARGGAGGAEGGGVMAVLLGASSRIVVQGFGRAGQLQARISRAYGSTVVAGVTPGRGGQRLQETPVYDTVRAAVAEQGANVSVIFVPAPFAADAILEAADGRHPGGDLHHRVHSNPRHGAGEALPARLRDPPDRTQLPRRDRPGAAGAGRHHAGGRVPAGQRRGDIAIRDPGVRGSGPIVAARHRAVRQRGRGRRSGDRHLAAGGA